MIWKPLLLMICLASTIVAADTRAPIPSKEQQAKSESLIRDVFKSDFAKTKHSERLTLASKLIKQAEESKSDPVTRYVLLRDARDLAGKSGGAEVAFHATELLIADFDVKALELQLEIAEMLSNAPLTELNAETATEHMIGLSNELKLAEDWESAFKMMKHAEVASRKSQNGPLMTNLKSRVRELELVKIESSKLPSSREALKAKPDDPDANLYIGRFYCLYQNDWSKGIPHLLKGSDTKLKTAAEKEIEAADGNSTARLAVADYWYDMVQTADASIKTSIQLRAHFHYGEVVSSLTGINKARVEKRMAELQPVVDARTDKSKMWTLIRKTVDAKQLKFGEIVGGAFAQNKFEEIPKEPSILVGFVYTTTSGGRYPGALQPLWLTSKGEVKGKAYGDVNRNHSPFNTTRARKGYAVGSIILRGGGGFDAFQPIYMKITEKGLDTNDSYKGPHIGGEGGSQLTVGGDGNFIIGIHGKSAEKGNKIEALSTITLKPKSK